MPRGGEFTLGGESYPLLRRRYGLTWVTERAVEVPVAQRLLERHRDERVLEVGNVLSHYGPVAHEVVDKYERAAGVRNADVLDLPSEPGYDLIVSVSTLEHVGRDEQPPEPERALRAFEHLRAAAPPRRHAVRDGARGLQPRARPVARGHRARPARHAARAVA